MGSEAPQRSSLERALASQRLMDDEFVPYRFTCGGGGSTGVGGSPSPNIKTMTEMLSLLPREYATSRRL